MKEGKTSFSCFIFFFFCHDGVFWRMLYCQHCRIALRASLFVAVVVFSPLSFFFFEAVSFCHNGPSKKKEKEITIIGVPVMSDGSVQRRFALMSLCFSGDFSFSLVVVAADGGGVCLVSLCIRPYVPVFVYHVSFLSLCCFLFFVSCFSVRLQMVFFFFSSIYSWKKSLEDHE